MTGQLNEAPGHAEVACKDGAMHEGVSDYKFTNVVTGSNGLLVLSACNQTSKFHRWGCVDGQACTAHLGRRAVVMALVDQCGNGLSVSRGSGN